MNERHWYATGQQRVDAPPDRLEAAYSYAIKSETHLWVAMVSHRVGDVALDQLEGKSTEPLLLDAESMLTTPSVGCYVCEEPFRSQLRQRKCPGEPKPRRR